jgi:hypothetical protein
MATHNRFVLYSYTGFSDYTNSLSWVHLPRRLAFCTSGRVNASLAFKRRDYLSIDFVGFIPRNTPDSDLN